MIYTIFYSNILTNLYTNLYIYIHILLYLVSVLYYVLIATLHKVWTETQESIYLGQKKMRHFWPATLHICVVYPPLFLQDLSLKGPASIVVSPHERVIT